MNNLVAQRVLVRVTDSDRMGNEDQLPEEEIDRLKNQPLIRRELSDGRFEWYMLTTRLPRDADTYVPREAAAFQLGVGSQLIHLDLAFAAQCQKCLGYIDDYPASRFKELENLLDNLRSAQGAAIVSYQLRLTSALTDIREGPWSWIAKGLELGHQVSLLNRDPPVSPSDLARLCCRSTTEISEKEPCRSWDVFANQLLDVVGTHARHDCTKEKLLWLLAHPLEKDGVRADFKSELIDTSKREHEELNLRLKARFGDKKLQAIISALSGRAMTLEQLAAELGVSPRSLSAQSRPSKNGKSRVTEGKLDLLKRAGVVAHSRELGGYYLPHDPPRVAEDILRGQSRHPAAKV